MRTAPSSAEQSRRSFFDHAEAISGRIAQARHIGLFLDFDGTLAEIVPVPEDAEISSEMRLGLTALVSRPDISVAVVSGRTIADLRKRVGTQKTLYVGNHGLEIEGESVRFREPKAEALRRDLRSLFLRLKFAMADIDGLEIEDKGLTLTVHYRRVTEHLHDWVRTTTAETVARSRTFSCRDGKMVVDVKPRIAWNKGYAVRWILREVFPPESLPVYLGDDATDEDAFAAIPEGITIRVGEPDESQARFHLPDVTAVGNFLKWLNHAKPHALLATAQRAGK